MSDLSDSKRLDSGGGAFADETKRSDSFIPTSISEDEARAARIYTEVEEMGEDFEVPDYNSEEEWDVEGSETNSVDNTQLNEPFSSTSKPSASQRPHLPFTNPAIIPTQNVVVSILILRCGVTLHFHPFVKAILTRYNVSPFQLTLKSYCITLGFYAMVEGTVSNMRDWKSKWFYVFKMLGVRVDFNRRRNRSARSVLDPTRLEISKVLSGLLVQDCDWRLLCVTIKLREHKLIPKNAKLQREPAADSSKKQHKDVQDKRKKVMIDPTVRATDIVALQEKFVSDKFFSKIDGIPPEDLMPRSTELALQFMEAEEKVKVLESRVTELGCDLDNEKEIGKKQYDQAISDYIYTTLTKLPDFDFPVFGVEAVEMANAFCAMSPIEIQGLEGNFFPEDAKNANADEAADGASKVADDPNTPAS
uniref:Uncharacterized protein n=1 Tax=Cannabis sativa TaxID=3483 RepID=A0A803PYM0_CANSA